MTWKNPPIIKVYEALGAIADGRVRVDGLTAAVDASSGNKTYTVTYDGDKQIMANDNGSYWVGYLGYPAIALLMLLGRLPFDDMHAQALEGIHWKDINTRFNNDFSKTEAYALERAVDNGYDREALTLFAEEVLHTIKTLNLERLGKQVKPPVEEKM